MARHTSPASRADDLAFPIRIKLVVPPTGFGGLLDKMDEWLRLHAPGAHANHPVQSSATVHATAFHFRSIEVAAAFLRAFPVLVLADGVGERDTAGAVHHTTRTR